MTCDICTTANLPANETGVQVCWCGSDVCAGCLTEHLCKCTYAKLTRMRDIPEKRLKGRA